MAVNDVSFSGNATKAVCLMVGQTANTPVPTLATDGIPVYPTNKISADDGHAFAACPPMSSTLMVSGTVNAGQVLTGTLTLWGYVKAFSGGGKWIEIPLNGGTRVTPVALAETDTDVITYSERLLDLGHYDRLYLQLTGIGGTGASFEAWLVTSRTIDF